MSRFWSISGIVLVLAWLCAPAFAQLSVGEEAPSFELEAWAFLAKGEKEPTAEPLKGKVVLIEFWGTWCGPASARCRASRVFTRGTRTAGSR